jgi:hypothetical protein
LTRQALATPQPGELFPVLTGKDLTGETRRTEEYVGARTLVVSISDRNAADAMRAWYAAADSSIPATVARRSIISLHLPFFVTTDFARSRAREQVPPAFWHATLLDRGDMSERLGQPESNLPFVYALDEQRHVLAVVHATVGSAESQSIWRALNAHGP